MMTPSINTSAKRKMTWIVLATVLWLNITVSATGSNPAQQYTLDEAIQTALDNNPAIQAGKSMVKASEARIMQARSFYVPKAEVLSRYFNTNNLPSMYPFATKRVPVMDANGPVPGEYVSMNPMAPFPDNNGNVFSFDLNISLPLYTGGKVGKANENAQTLKTSTEFDLEQTKQEIILNVKTAFYNILFIQELIRVNQDAMAQLNEHLEQAQQAYREGLRSEFDVLSFESKIEGFKSTLADLNGKLDMAKTGLKNLLSLPMDMEVECEGKITEPMSAEIPEPSATLSAVMKNNYQLRSLGLKKVMVRNLETIAKADRKPTLFAFSNYHIYHGMDFPPFNEAWRNGYAIGLGLKMNIFDGNLTKGKALESRANAERITAFEDGLKLKLRYELQNVYENIHALNARREALLSNLKVAEKAYHIATIGYNNGVITNLELNDAQLHLTGIKTKLLNVDKELLLAKARLDYLKGSGKGENAQSVSQKKAMVVKSIVYF